MCNFTWEKKGLIFKPKKNFDWMNSHAQVPTVLVKEKEKIVRVYLSSRPNPTLSITSFVDLNINDLHKIEYLNPNPILELGGLGTFDEHGIMPSSVVDLGKEVYLYYSGWQRAVGVPYNNYTGLAISIDEGQTFKKYSTAPILDRNKNELYSATSPCVRKINGKWHMWYCSGTNWLEVDGKMEHTYDIKYASSSDGKIWAQTGIVCIKQKNKFEAITKPTVAHINGKYHMWYCFRGSKDFRDGNEGYRVGYAESNDGLKWIRKDNQSGITTSKRGWDSKMLAYPEVFEVNGNYYMLYNGNSFGKDGFGYATLENLHS